MVKSFSFFFPREAGLWGLLVNGLGDFGFFLAFSFC